MGAFYRAAIGGGGGGFTGVAVSRGSVTLTGVNATRTITLSADTCEKIIAADVAVPYGNQQQNSGYSNINTDGTIYASGTCAITGDNTVRLKSAWSATYKFFYNIYYIPKT